MERPSDGHDDNLIVLLHGRGDSERPFASLARAYVLAIAAEVRKPPHFRRSTGTRESVAL